MRCAGQAKIEHEGEHMTFRIRQEGVDIFLDKADGRIQQDHLGGGCKGAVNLLGPGNPILELLLAGDSDTLERELKDLPQIGRNHPTFIEH